MIYIRKVIAEYVFSIEGLEQTVKGRIVKSDEIPHLPYQWDISHYCMPFEDAAGVYIPGRFAAETVEEATDMLISYAKSFTTFGVQKNPFY